VARRIRRAFCERRWWADAGAGSAVVRWSTRWRISGAAVVPRRRGPAADPSIYDGLDVVEPTGFSWSLLILARRSWTRATIDGRNGSWRPSSVSGRVIAVAGGRFYRRAVAASGDTAGPSAQAGKSLIDRLLGAGIDGVGPFKSADECADEAMGRGRTPEQAIRSLIRTHVAMAGAQGFVLNLGGMMTTAVALPANIGAAYLIQTRLAASIARVHGHDLQTEEVRTAILLCLLGNNAAEVVKKVGVAVGERMTAKLIRQVPIKIIREINKKVGFRLLTKAGESGAIVLTKGIPVVGGVIGAGFDAAATRAVGEFARRFLSTDTDGPTEPDRRWSRKRLTALRATLGRRFGKAKTVDLTRANATPDTVDVRIGWNSTDTEVDASAFVCDRDGRVRSDLDFIYVNNRSSPDGSITQVDVPADAAADSVRAVFTVDLTAMSAEVHAVRFAVSIYEDRSTLADVEDLFLQALDQQGIAEPVTCDLTGDHPNDTAAVIGELRRTRHGWQFNEIDEGHPGGLASIAKSHGVDVYHRSDGDRSWKEVPADG
jgi:stress response protein SCP2